MHEVGRPDHASTEQLSALLDDRAEPGERTFLTGHVEGCPVCSNELADLRSVRDLLRALPVYLPPRSFTIPIGPAVRRRPFRRLIPVTRALGALAAVLCVVLFSVDAMQIGSEAAPPRPGDSAFQITTAAKATNGPPAPAAKPADAGRSAAEAGKPAAAFAPSGAGQTVATTVTATTVLPQPALAARPAESVAQQPAADSLTAPRVAASPAIAAAPAAPPPPGGAAQSGPAASGAPAAPAPAAAAQAPAPTMAIQSPPTLASAGAGPPAPVPTQAAAGARPDSQVSLERPGPVRASPWLSPLRLASVGFAVVAALLLIGSLVLSRLARTRARGQQTGR